MTDSTDTDVDVHSLLLDYALTHLTRDYVGYVSDLVSQILTTNLRPVAIRDSSSLDPAGDQLDFIFRSLNISLFEERLVISHGALNYLKKAGAGPPTPLSQIDFEAECVRVAAVKSGWRQSRPLYTALRRKRLHRPSDSISVLHQTILSKFSLKALEIEQDATTDSSTNTDHILDLKIPIDSQTQSKILSLIRSNPFFARFDPDYTNPFVAEFLPSFTPKYLPPHFEGLLSFPSSSAPELLPAANPEVEESTHMRHVFIPDVHE